MNMNADAADAPDTAEATDSGSLSRDASRASSSAGPWVAFGPAGAVGSVHRTEGGYTFKLLADPGYRSVYPNLEVAKSALHASLGPGSDWPEFREH